MSFPNRGEGGGAPHLGKIPTFSRFFFLGASLRLINIYKKKKDKYYSPEQVAKVISRVETQPPGNGIT